MRTGHELESYEGIDTRVRGVALSFGGREARYSALIAADVLKRAEYPHAFPHHLLFAGRYLSPAAGASEPKPHLKPVETEWCLSPAVCYHVYAHLAGSVLREPVVLTARGTCFRYERQRTPGVRQVEFAMREIVLLGPRQWVRDSASAVAQAIESLAGDLGLEGDWRTAADPFFLPAARGKATLQRLTKAKHEYQLRDDSRLALASVNRHAAFFSQRFQINAADGAPVHSACIAVGLDRWWHAVRPRYSVEHGTSHVGQEVRL